MKTIRIFSSLLFIVMFLPAGFTLQAQQTEDELAKEKQLQEKQMEHEKQMEEMQARKEMLEEQQDKMRDMERHHAEQSRAMEARARESSRVRASYRSSGQFNEPFVAPMLYQGNQSQLTLRNSFKGGSDSSKGDFQVEKDTRHFRCMINGKVNSGEILIKIQYPGGIVFKELTINSSAEISFNQSLTIKEGEGDKYLGTWKYEIKATKAEGNYMLQISTN